MTQTAHSRSAIEAIREKLQRHPHLRAEETATSITVQPESPDGFPVRLDQHSRGYTVSFAGWHEEFESYEESEALNCFAFGLSERCRLRVLSRGSFDYRWIVQHFKDDAWHDDSETGLLVFPFWLRRRERYLQNHVTPVI
jgi:hypothetical protein